MSDLASMQLDKLARCMKVNTACSYYNVKLKRQIAASQHQCAGPTMQPTVDHSFGRAYYLSPTVFFRNLSVPFQPSDTAGDQCKKRKESCSDDVADHYHDFCFGLEKSNELLPLSGNPDAGLADHSSFLQRKLKCSVGKKRNQPQYIINQQQYGGQDNVIFLAAEPAAGFSTFFSSPPQGLVPGNSGGNMSSQVVKAPSLPLRPELLDMHICTTDNLHLVYGHMATPAEIRNIHALHRRLKVVHLPPSIAEEQLQALEKHYLGCANKSLAAEVMYVCTSCALAGKPVPLRPNMRYSHLNRRFACLTCHRHVRKQVVSSQVSSSSSTQNRRSVLILGHN